MRTLLLVLLVSTATFAQKKDPVKKDPVKPPDAATIQKIKDETAKLKAAVEELRQKNVYDARIPDIEIYAKAGEWIVRHNEWFTADAGKQTLAVLAEGATRLESAKDGKSPWRDVDGKAVARGYRSRIDESIQPYGVLLPADYGKDPKKLWRLDVHLHGRDGTLTEVKHLAQHAGSKSTPKDQDYIQINVYGRGNNAYRWAGEQDVFEAVRDFLDVEWFRLKHKTVDLNRIVLKGFSMGGAGTWQVGLRNSAAFAVLQPGAGFTTTHGYVAKLPDPLPDYQEKCLRIYDADRYAENAFNVPIVAYSGEIDKQRQAAVNIENELKRLKLSDRMTHLIGPGLEHKFPPEWVKKSEEVIRKHLDQPRAKYPTSERVVTYTAKNGLGRSLHIIAQEAGYEQSSADYTRTGRKVVIQTKNVRGLALPFDVLTKPEQLQIDGQSVSLEKARSELSVSVLGDHGPSFYVWKVGGTWQLEAPKQVKGRLNNRVWAVTGPIDDAFIRPFHCVIGTGTPMHPAMHKASMAQFERFRKEWDKWMRAELPVVKDTDLRNSDRGETLILFGDPGSNKVIARALPQLPLVWTRTDLNMSSAKADPKTHLPMLIHPNPESPENHYVVLNSGHTFHEADFQGTNALLYPRLGDYAVVKPTPTAKDPAAFDVVTAGLFDEKWQFPKK
jgi:hypothetical protein